MANLLQTKIALPPLRRQYIHRDRVLQPVSDSPAARLVLVSAPAGFGKSTALLQWAHQQQEAETVIAWYAVDERDNDPARFAAYLLAAFRLAGIQLSDSEEGIEVQEAVNLILNSVAQLDDPVLLLLDDYHLISEPQIHDAIRRLCEYMPRNMRLAIGSRVDPPLPLARLRSRGEMAEIRMADLRFSNEELRQWCDVSLGWSPSHSSIETLQKTTEGWAAALALIMMSRPHADEAGLVDQLARYSQSQRHIFDYFAQEILEHQPEELRSFLLDTCVLEQLAPQLCTAVADNPHAPLLLDQLAAESLFLIPLSNTEPIYRYHHLFAQFLRQYLTLRDRERYRRQHHRAAQWYAGHDNPVTAVDHALAAEEFDDAARLIVDEAYAPLMARGEFMTVVNWQSHFSTEALARHLRLWLYFIRALYLSGHIELAETQVRLSEEALARDGENGAERQALQAIACNYRATLAAYRGDLAAGMRWIEQAKDREEWVGERDRMRIASAGAFIRYLMGDVAGARHAYGQTLAMAERLDEHWVILDVHYYLAQLDLLSGDLEAAEARCRRLLDAYPARLAPRIPLMLPLAEVLYQRDRAVEAEALLREALAQAEGAGQPSTGFFAHIALSGILAVRGDVAEAEASIVQARAWAEGYQSPMIEALIDAAAARLMLQCGRVEAAAAWAADYENAAEADYEEDGQKITLARVWLAQGEPERALEILTEVGETAQAAGRAFHALEADVVRALAYRAAGNPDAALAPLERALTLAQPQRIVRLFIDLGRPMQLLLRRAVAQNAVSAYAQFLLDSAERGDAAPRPDDLLTERELEVLAEVAAGASNQEIAETLVISVGTVKSHIHHIMSKLDAQNRTEAVTKARNLNILPE